MFLPKLSTEEQIKFNSGIIQVNGKSMNRTALGIIDAFLTLYPKVTYAQLKEAFPDKLNPSGPKQVKSIFQPFTEKEFGVVHSLEEIKTEFVKADLPYDGLFFLEESEMFKTADGVIVIVNKLWETNDTSTSESDLENLSKQALKFGIVVNKFEPVEAFGRGSYSLDIIQKDLYHSIRADSKSTDTEILKENKPSRKSYWVWIALSLAILALTIWFINKK